MKRDSFLRFVFSFVKNKKRFLFEIIIDIVLVVCTFLSARLLAKVIAILGSGNVDVAKQLVLLLGIYIISLALQKLYFELHMNNEKETRIEAKKVVMSAILGTRDTSFEKNYSARIQETIYSDCNNVTAFIYSLLGIMENCLCLIFAGIVLGQISLFVILTITAVMLGFVVWVKKSSKKVKLSTEDFLKSNDQLFTLTRGLVGYKRFIELSNSEQYYIEKYSKQIEDTKEKLVNKERKVWGIHFLSSIYEKMWLFFSIGLMIAWSLNGRFEIYDISMFFVYSKLFCAGIVGISNSISSLNSIFASLERVKQAISGAQPKMSDDKKTLKKVDSIKFTNVSFSYNDKVVFTNFNHSFCKGLNLIIGPNGSGKSTLLNLIAGLLHKTSGEISINDYSIECCSQEDRKKKIIYFAQGDTLIEGTIKENIISCDELRNIDDNTICENLSQLGLMQDISLLPNRIDTEISEMRDLSYGQKKKILLTRTFLRDGDIYLFDEPLDGLDESSRNIVKEKILKKAEEAVVIVVTHHSNCFIEAESIVKLDNICFE